VRSDFEPLFDERVGWQRIYVDLPGHGQTEWPPWVSSPDQILDLLMEFIDDVIPNQHFALAGLSWGAHLCLGIIDRRPEFIEGVCLYAPAVEMERSLRKLPYHSTLVENENFQGQLTEDEEFLCDFFVKQDDVYLQRVRDEIIGVGEKSAKQDIPFDVGDNPLDFDARQVKFDGPALILTGRQDCITGYQDAWDIIENFHRATFAVLDCAGHFLSLEQNSLFHALAREWLDRMK